MSSALLMAAVAEAPEAAEPTFLGLNPGGWVAVAILVVFVILVWKKVPGAVGRALGAGFGHGVGMAQTGAVGMAQDGYAYEAKSASADKDREALLERARHEAQEIVAKAKSDSELLIERRTRMAEDKIAAEERTAVEQLRATAADAATKAAARIIAERHDASTDAKLVDQAIKEIAR